MEVEKLLQYPTETYDLYSEQASEVTARFSVGDLLN